MLDLSRDEKATCPPKPRAAAETLLAEEGERSADMTFKMWAEWNDEARRERVSGRLEPVPEKWIGEVP